MNAHTPGPWQASFDHPAPECQKSIAYIRQAAYKDGEFTMTQPFYRAGEIATIYGCDESDEIAANARLIAAAPELLEACMAVLASPVQLTSTGFPGVDEELRAARKLVRAAVKKATKP